MLEMKATLAHLVRNFTFTLDSERPIEPAWYVTLGPRTGMHVYMHKRSFWVPGCKTHAVLLFLFFGLFSLFDRRTFRFVGIKRFESQVLHEMINAVARKGPFHLIRLQKKKKKGKPSVEKTCDQGCQLAQQCEFRL
jgi:hypothetical protein